MVVKNKQANSKIKRKLKYNIIKMRKHRNQRQEEIFIGFMTSHPSIAKGFTKGDKVEVDHLWSQLEVELNAAEPPIKDVRSWKKVWIDWKANIKQKLSHNKSEVRATGGGQYNQYILTPADQDVANLCSLQTFVKGFEGSKNYGVNKSQTIMETATTSSPTPPSPSTSSSSSSSSPSPTPVCSQNRKRKLSLNELMETENTNLEKKTEKNLLNSMKPKMFLTRPNVRVLKNVYSAIASLTRMPSFLETCSSTITFSQSYSLFSSSHSMK